METENFEAILGGNLPVEEARIKPRGLSHIPILQLKDQWDWLEALWELWVINKGRIYEDSNPFYIGITKSEQVLALKTLKNEWNRDKLEIGIEGIRGKLDGVLYENLEHVAFIRQRLEEAYNNGMETSLIEFLGPYAEYKPTRTDNPGVFGYLFLDLFHHVLDIPLHFFEKLPKAGEELGVALLPGNILPYPYRAPWAKSWEGYYNFEKSRRETERQQAEKEFLEYTNRTKTAIRKTEKSDLSPGAQRLLEVIRSNPGLTDKQLAPICKKDALDDEGAKPGSIRAWRSELIKGSRIQGGGTRPETWYIATH